MGHAAAANVASRQVSRIFLLKSAAATAVMYVARRLLLLSFHIHHGSPTLGIAQYTVELGY